LPKRAVKTFFWMFRTTLSHIPSPWQA
jgi:hypothetical protein